MSDPVFGFLVSALAWRNLRHAIETIYVPEPPYGAFALNRRTLTTAILNNGKTVSLNDQSSVQSDTASTIYTNAVEFTIEALSGVLSIGFARPGSIATDDYTFGAGVAYASSNGTFHNSTTSPSPGPWVVGDVIALVGNLVLRNGVNVTGLSNGGSGDLCFVVSQAGGTLSRVTAETKLSKMTYAAAYTAALADGSSTPPVATSWPIASVSIEPAATAIVLSPPTATASTGAESAPFTAKINGAISGTVNATVVASAGTITTSPLAFTNTDRRKTFTATGTADGAHSISVTNDGGLTNPSAATLTTSSGSTDTALTDRVMTNFTAVNGVNQYFKVDVPPGATGFNIRAYGDDGTADFDLYIQRDSRPTLSLYDNSTTVTGTTEGALYDNGSAGHTLFFMVVPRANFTANLKPIIQQTIVLTSGVPATVDIDIDGTSPLFTIAVGAGASNLNIAATRTGGTSATLIRFGADPDIFTNDYSFANAGSQGIATPTAGVWHIGINFTGSSPATATLTATVT